MDKNVQEVIFNELLSRYNRLFYKIILEYFQELDDAKDVYQDFSIHLYSIIEKTYSKKSDLFDSKPWIISVLKNFCISEIRKRSGKRKIKFKEVDQKDVILSLVKDESEFNIGEINDDIQHVINDLIKNLDRRDILILKMKYIYGKPSSYISRKMNEAHVDVYIARLKKKIKKDCGVHNFNELISKFNLSL